MKIYILSIAVSVMALSPVLAVMEYATPESQGVSSKAICDFIDGCEKRFNGARVGRVHGFVLVRHGKVIAEGSWKPFDTLNEPHMLYSHSKSFTSSAIGLLVDEGKLDLDERIVDIFPDETPKDASDNLRQLRVRDLLTMNVGCPKDHWIGRYPKDWVREFLAKPIVNKPGTGFKYDSDATYMLAAIVEKRSGEKMMDFLKNRMFDVIGIKSAWSTYSPEGIPCGGWGMNMTTRELARFGQLYLQNGFWEGKTVLSPSWVGLATARHTWSGWKDVGVKALGEGSDWEQGYGFQFWRCRYNAYRADGAAGQLTVVMPEKDAVISVSAAIADMQKELNLIWDILLPAMEDVALPENPDAQKSLEKRLAELSVPAMKSAANKADDVAWLGKTFELKPNRRGFKSVRIERKSDGFELVLVVPAGEQRIPLGDGVWKCGEMGIDVEKYEKLGGYIGQHKTAGSCSVGADGSFDAEVHLVRDTGVIFINVRREGESVRLRGHVWVMGECALESVGEPK